MTKVDAFCEECGAPIGEGSPRVEAPKAEAVTYRDADGNECSLDKLCRLEPAWAASRIRVGLEEIKRLRSRIMVLDEIRSEQTERIKERIAEVDGLRAKAAAAVAGYDWSGGDGDVLAVALQEIAGLERGAPPEHKP